MLCRNCNRETLEGAAFCTHCGTAVRYSCPRVRRITRRRDVTATLAAQACWLTMHKNRMLQPDLQRLTG